MPAYIHPSNDNTKSLHCTIYGHPQIVYFTRLRPTKAEKIAVRTQIAMAYNLQGNDTDWLHTTFLELFHTQQRLQKFGGIQREHSLYGPQVTRLSWIYPPAHRFLVKPQTLLMPEVFVDDANAEDTATASTEAVDGDALRDSMGGPVVSPFRDVFIHRGRREIDVVVTKKLANGFQMPLLVVEIKRDDVQESDAVDQISDYLHCVMLRCVALGYGHVPLYGLLVLGSISLRLISTFHPEEPQARAVYTRILDEEPGYIEYVPTDSTLVNSWLLAQSLAWRNL